MEGLVLSLNPLTGKMEPLVVDGQKFVAPLPGDSRPHIKIRGVFRRQNQPLLDGSYLFVQILRNAANSSSHGMLCSIDDMQSQLAS